MPNASDEEIRKVLKRLQDEQALPPQSPSLADVLGEWGTRGFVAGFAVGLAIIPVSILVTRENAGPNSKIALAVAMMAGICTGAGALAGLAVGFAAWLSRRDKSAPLVSVEASVNPVAHLSPDLGE